MKPKVYIDGKEGTTGLQIYDRLAARADIELLLIDEDKRKDPAERKKFLNEADLVFLCLPDDAAREAVSMVENPATRIIDASTAHRTAQDWAYGFPELSQLHRALICKSKRVSNPGCHATGFISSVYPLSAMGVLPKDYPLTCFSLTGYSGGGKKMIAEYEGEKGGALFYASNYCLGVNPPVFSPVVDDYYKGMATTISLHNDLLSCGKSAKAVWETLADYYRDQAFIHVAPLGGETPMLAANTLAGRDTLTLVVCGNETHTTVTALFDNLGKGASGAAVQNMNLMLGFPETTGLNL